MDHTSTQQMYDTDTRTWMQPFRKSTVGDARSGSRISCALHFLDHEWLTSRNVPVDQSLNVAFSYCKASTAIYEYETKNVLAILDTQRFEKRPMVAKLSLGDFSDMLYIGLIFVFLCTLRYYTSVSAPQYLSPNTHSNSTPPPTQEKVS